MNSKTDMLLKVLDQAYNKGAWHGTNLKGSIRGLKGSVLLWRPAPGRHNIWEIMLHTAYWKYAVRRKLTQEKRGSFARKGADWPALPNSPTDALWKLDVALLGSEHTRLREAILLLPPGKLESIGIGLKWRNEQYIYGAASHDLYHAGQIQLIKRMYRGRKPPE